MMEKACFNTQVSYCLAMSYVHSLFANGLLSEGEMAAAEEALFKSESPLVRQLSLCIALT
jgi:hypothetical protein